MAKTGFWAALFLFFWNITPFCAAASPQAATALAQGAVPPPQIVASANACAVVVVTPVVSTNATGIVAPVVAEAVPEVPLGTIWVKPSDHTMDFFNHDLYTNRLTGWHTNYGVIASDHGETRIQFQLSLKYELFQYSEEFWNSRWAYFPEGVNLAYDGLYDFYWFTRPASPVISRDQNPGMFVHFLPRKNVRFFNADYFDAGWFHESNGQTTITAAQYNALYATEGDHVQDSVHRGWDYWYFGSKFSYLPFDQPELWNAKTVTRMHNLFTFLPSFRFYDGKQGLAGSTSENIFYKPVGFQPYIYDYDGLRATFMWETIFPECTWLRFHYVGLGLDVRTGYNYHYFASNWSRKVTLTFKTGYFPWYVYYFNGYGPYISDYTTFSTGWGIGIRLI
jgi:outer membrane phospholipase A